MCSQIIIKWFSNIASNRKIALKLRNIFYANSIKYKKNSKTELKTKKYPKFQQISVKIQKESFKINDILLKRCT